MGKLSFVLVPFLASAFAIAAPKPGAQHQPALSIDFTSLRMNLISRSEQGYGANVSIGVLGATSAKDRLRLEWKAGGKKLGVAECKDRRNYDANSKELTADCELETNLKQKGAVAIDVIYIDDSNDQDYLVGTLQLDVKQWAGPGKSQFWGIVPDDLPALGWVVHSKTDQFDRRALFRFWSSTESMVKDATMRCTVNGKQIPDFDARADSLNNDSFDHGYTNNKVQRRYSFTRVRIESGFHWGNKADPEYKGSGDKVKWAMDNPGAWDCKLRFDGKVARQFTFTVTPDGKITSDMKPPAAWNVPPDTTLIEMRIPKDTNMEKRIRPDALRRSVGFGLPWPSGGKVKEIQASFPPAMGTPD